MNGAEGEDGERAFTASAFFSASFLLSLLLVMLVATAAVLAVAATAIATIFPHCPLQSFLSLFFFGWKTSNKT